MSIIEDDHRVVLYKLYLRDKRWLKNGMRGLHKLCSSGRPELTKNTNKWLKKPLIDSCSRLFLSTFCVASPSYNSCSDFGDAS